MCLIALSVKKELDWKGKEAYFFTLVANRDEYHDRPTTHLHWWKGDQILAGKDNLAGGTWLGFSKSGRFATLTNFKENTFTVVDALFNNEYLHILYAISSLGS